MKFCPKLKQTHELLPRACQTKKQHNAPEAILWVRSL